MIFYAICKIKLLVKNMQTVAVQLKYKLVSIIMHLNYIKRKILLYCI